MLFIKKYLSKKYLPFLVFVLAILVLTGGIIFHHTNQVVKIELYGSAVDPTTLTAWQSILTAQSYLAGNVILEYHPVLKTTADGLTSYTLDQSEQTAPQQSKENLVKEETEEALRQRVLARYGFQTLNNYLQTRFRETFSADEAIKAIDLNPKIINWLKEKERDSLQKDSAYFAELINKHELNRFPVPQVFLNGQLYSGSGSAQALAAQAAKILLRRGQDELPVPWRLNLFGGRLSLALQHPYQINGIFEAYSDADCQDNPQKTGILTDKDTAYMRCAYRPPTAVLLSVYGAATTQTTELIDRLTAGLKGMSVRTVTDQTERLEVQKIINNLKLPDTVKELTKEPYLVFEPSLTEDPIGLSYLNSGLLIPLPDNRLLFNTVPFLGK